MTFLVTVIPNPRQKNCFGYVSPTRTPMMSWTTFGVFHCILMQKDEPRSFIVQIFGERPPFNYLHLNPSFAAICGVFENDQVLLEPVIHMPNCQRLELEPDTFEDWNILENSSCVVEELFLDQIRIVQNGMNFVLFVGPNVPVKFRVVRTEPETGRESAVMVDNSTEVMVIPKENPLKDRFPSRPSSRLPSRPSSRLPSRPSSRPSTCSFFADKIGGSDTLSYSNLIREFISSQEKVLNLRIFPLEFIDESVDEMLQKFKTNVVFVLNGNRSNHVKKSIINIKSGLTGKSVFGFLFENPENPFDEEQRKMTELLKRNLLADFDLEFRITGIPRVQQYRKPEISSE